MLNPNALQTPIRIASRRWKFIWRKPEHPAEGEYFMGITVTAGVAASIRIFARYDEAFADAGGLSHTAA